MTLSRGQSVDYKQQVTPHIVTGLEIKQKE